MKLKLSGGVRSGEEMSPDEVRWDWSWKVLTTNTRLDLTDKRSP